MTDQLQGRALDESAAIAMGWTVERGYYGSFDRWTSPSGESPSGEFWTGVAFSTDPARISEMLAWFDNQGIELIIGNNPKSSDWTKWEAEAMPEPPGQCCLAHGTTLSEALARLVVAVAAAKGAK